MNSSAEIDPRTLAALEEKFDPEMRFRPTLPPATTIVKWLLIVLSCFHYYTAGFGLLRETTHRAIHMAFVLGLIFLVFAGRKADVAPRASFWRPGGVPLTDRLLALAVAVSVLYIPYIFDGLAFRVGNPLTIDVAMGTVLFGVLATRIGLGQLFLDIASMVAGRYAGGPAKVSVFGSAMFGMLSGSSAANAVTVGSLTIPAMIRVGYPRHFAAGVEAAASAGGQITPPIMGAAAFLMVEFLALPYQTIILAAIVPAFMHFYGVFMQVHFEANRRGLRGLTEAEMPKLRESLMARWPTLIPLVLLIGILVSGRTPYLAAFTGISSRAIVGLTTSVRGNRPVNWALLVLLHAVLVVLAFGGIESLALRVGVFSVVVVGTPFVLRALDIRGRIGGAALVEAFETGAKYALAVGAAAATVGNVIGVVRLTGVGFKISYIITTAAQAIAGGMLDVLPQAFVSTHSLTLFAALLMTGVVCVLMGCGIPTAANYLIMVAVAAPTLVQLGVQPLVAHFFVFYYGVLADITPPVALAAYAAAGMAGSDPFKTGNTAFRLGLGKVLVPFVFVFSPSLLLVTQSFSWPDFAGAFIGCVLGITIFGAAFSRWFLIEMTAWEQGLCVVASLLMIVPGIAGKLLGLALISPMLWRHLAGWRAGRARLPSAI